MLIKKLIDLMSKNIDIRQISLDKEYKIEEIEEKSIKNINFLRK